MATDPRPRPAASAPTLIEPAAPPSRSSRSSRSTYERYALARSPYWRKLVAMRRLLARLEANAALARPDPEALGADSGGAGAAACDQATLQRLRESVAWVEAQALRLESHTHGPAVGALFCRQCGLARCDWPRSDKE